MIVNNTVRIVIIKNLLIFISIIVFSNTLYSQGFIWNDKTEAHHKTYDKVSLSPHIGGSTVEAQERIGDEIVKEIKSFYKLNE